MTNVPRYILLKCYYIFINNVYDIDNFTNIFFNYLFLF